MKLTFEQDNVNRKIVGRFVLGERYQAAADLRMAELLRRSWMRRWVRSAGFARFERDRGTDGGIPETVNVQSEIVVEGRETERKGRNLFMTGEIRNGAGEVLARGKGRFVVIGQK